MILYFFGRYDGNNHKGNYVFYNFNLPIGVLNMRYEMAYKETLLIIFFFQLYVIIKI